MPWRRDAWQVRASCADVGEKRFLQRDRLLDERSRAVPELGVRVPAEGGEVDRVVGAGGRVVDSFVDILPLPISATRAALRRDVRERRLVVAAAVGPAEVLFLPVVQLSIGSPL